MFGKIPVMYTLMSEYYVKLNFIHATCVHPGGGGHSTFFQGVRPVFPKCGACELTFASEKGGF